MRILTVYFTSAAGSTPLLGWHQAGREVRSLTVYFTPAAGPTPLQGWHQAGREMKILTVHFTSAAGPTPHLVDGGDDGHCYSTRFH